MCYFFRVGDRPLISKRSKTFLSRLFNYRDIKLRAGHFSTVALSPDCTMFVFFSFPNTNLRSTDGLGAIIWGGNNSSVERGRRSGGKRSCHAWRRCVLWGMTRWLGRKKKHRQQKKRSNKVARTEDKRAELDSEGRGEKCRMERCMTLLGFEFVSSESHTRGILILEG